MVHSVRLVSICSMDPLTGASYLHLLLALFGMSMGHFSGSNRGKEECISQGMKCVEWGGVQLPSIRLCPQLCTPLNSIL